MSEQDKQNKQIEIEAQARADISDAVMSAMNDKSLDECIDALTYVMANIIIQSGVSRVTVLRRFMERTLTMHDLISARGDNDTIQ